eukprot:TRINITY_DN75570_c0_g1_i1.p1 TRINITY_DN75570_c0_g1~~TRINITY_DN75570_c0_g1_i1.p1  ORF type:complete len:137 (+),score=30.02 TRINITY_DN75570_c0_g1_i1:55-411(+)
MASLRALTLRRSLRWTPPSSGLQLRCAASDASSSQAEPESLAVPLWAKAGGAAVGVALLLAFHSTIVTQREQKEAFYRGQIQTLQEEVSLLKAKLKEVERARWRGKLPPKSDMSHQEE